MTGVSSPSCSSSTSGSDPTASDHPSAPSVCDAPDQPCPHRLEAISLRQQAHYYKAMHQRALQRERHLQQEVALLQAELRDLRHRLFGRTSEAHHTPDCLDLDVPPTENAAPRPAGSEATEPAPAAPAAQRPRRPRGQRRGGKGHGRRDYSHLPTDEEVSDLPADQCRCQRCGQPFALFPGTDDSTVLEVEVKAHRRLVHR